MIKLILWISKIQLDIMEENQYHLNIVCEASKGNFVVHNFWFVSRNCLEKWIHLFLPERFPNFWGLSRRCFRNYETPCFTEGILQSRFILKCTPVLPVWNIRYNFTRLAIFYLKHLYSKTLHHRYYMDEHKTRLPLLWVGLLVTLHTFVFIHIRSVVKPVHTFMARSRVSESCLKAELCFHRYVHFVCVPTYFFGFHHKHCASD